MSEMLFLSLVFISKFYAVFASIAGRKSLAVYIVTNILENDTYIKTPESVDLVLSMLASLIQDQSDQDGIEDDPEDFDEEQGLLGR